MVNNLVLKSWILYNCIQFFCNDGLTWTSLWTRWFLRSGVTILCHSLVDWTGAAMTAFCISSGRMLRVGSIRVLAIWSYCGPPEVDIGGRLIGDGTDIRWPGCWFIMPPVGMPPPGRTLCIWPGDCCCWGSMLCCRMPGMFCMPWGRGWAWLSLVMPKARRAASRLAWLGGPPPGWRLGAVPLGGTPPTGGPTFGCWPGTGGRCSPAGPVAANMSLALRRGSA